jgi:ferritin
MLDKKISKLLNEQINKEFYSAYLYLDFANYFTDAGLDGFANWFTVQAKEEQDHAMLMNQYLHNNADKVTLEALAKPDVPLKNHMDPLKGALAHEQLVTASIHNIYGVASEQKDYRTMQFLDWFVKEQGEEEKNAEDNIKKYDLYGSDAKGLYALNGEMAARMYAPPSLVL